jgi:hypothetical protein
VQWHDILGFSPSLEFVSVLSGSIDPHFHAVFFEYGKRESVARRDNDAAVAVGLRNIGTPLESAAASLLIVVQTRPSLATGYVRPVTRTEFKCSSDSYAVAKAIVITAAVLSPNAHTIVRTSEEAATG